MGQARAVCVEMLMTSLKTMHRFGKISMVLEFGSQREVERITSGVQSLGGDYSLPACLFVKIRTLEDTLSL